jgi:hypothetical protein
MSELLSKLEADIDLHAAAVQYPDIDNYGQQMIDQDNYNNLLDTAEAVRAQQAEQRFKQLVAERFVNAELRIIFLKESRGLHYIGQPMDWRVEGGSDGIGGIDTHGVQRIRYVGARFAIGESLEQADSELLIALDISDPKAAMGFLQRGLKQRTVSEKPSLPKNELLGV